uniref:5-formyltetrahydrofolate cyclo-ligase isoform X2 n=1 Tax=Myxine glutinosa TaxID=7769 RepID=UPI00358EE890
MATKAGFRAQVKAKLAAMTTAERACQSALITEKLIKHPKFVRSTRISIYLSMPEEPSTWEILGSALRVGKACFVPRYASNRTHMDMLRVSSMEDVLGLPRTKWNIQQPAMVETDREDAMQTGGLDLVLVPGLAFDSQGNRLGRGKGYYDTFLHRCRIPFPDALHTSSPECSGPYTIGLAFLEMLYPGVPVHEHDVIINEIISP